MTANPQTVLAEPIVRPAIEKESDLRALMRSMGAVLVAYSGGVDSSYLAAIATEELGDNSLIVMGLSPSVSQHQSEVAVEIAAERGFRFRTIETGEMNVPDYRANPSNRCYYCKAELYGRLTEYAANLKLPFVLDGTNHDDLTDHRPGRVAAGENGIRSPLAETGFTKSDIRERSKALGLRSWDKPSSPCLSSRIAYGTPVTIGRLTKVERGEEILREFGFRESRVRVHGELARIEIGQDELRRVLDPELFESLSLRFKDLGFLFVTLDLQGFRSGSMNEPLNKKVL